MNSECLFIIKVIEITFLIFKTIYVLTCYCWWQLVSNELISERKKICELTYNKLLTLDVLQNNDKQVSRRR